MIAELRTLLSELDRPDLPDAAKQVVQLEIEKFLGRNARKILAVLNVYEALSGESLARISDPPTH